LECSVSELFGDKINDWRFYLFSDSGILKFIDALPGVRARFALSSVGIGSRVQLLDHFNGEINLGLPLVRSYLTEVPDYLLTFRVGAEF
jgi:hemolysin activation/secretion protein